MQQQHNPTDGTGRRHLAQISHHIMVAANCAEVHVLLETQLLLNLD